MTLLWKIPEIYDVIGGHNSFFFFFHRTMINDTPVYRSVLSIVIESSRINPNNFIHRVSPNRKLRQVINGCLTIVSGVACDRLATRVKKSELEIALSSRCDWNLKFQKLAQWE